MGDAAAGPDEPVVLLGGSHSQAVRVGSTVRRVTRPWSSSIQELLRHVEQQGFDGAPRALGVDERGRDVLTFVEGEVGTVLPEVDDGSVTAADHGVRRDDVLAHLGRLVRRYHDAAATFPREGRTWQVEVEQPAETICHNDLSPANVILRDGVPAAIIDWEAASPGPRAADLGFAAWRWVPLWPEVPCGRIYTSLDEKARRLRLLLDAYGIDADHAFLDLATARLRRFLDHLRESAAAGSAWELRLTDRGVLDRLADEIGWVERHATELVGANPVSSGRASRSGVGVRRG